MTAGRTGRVLAGLVGGLALLLTACSEGTLAASDTSSRPVRSSVAAPTVTGPTVIVTVPELVLADPAASVVPASGTDAPEPAAAPVPADAAASAASATQEAATAQTPTEAAAAREPATAQTPATPEPATTPAAATPTAPPGPGFNVSLANCDGCTVLATHRDVAGGRSAALVSTGSGRGILLSVSGEGQVAGVIGVPYGAAFGAPPDGVLPCAQGRCVVQARQSDGRAILSAFELTDSGAWRDVSGDDAFPSATERSAVVDLDGELGVAVQDQGDGAAVWMLYTWGGDRFAVLGCAPDGDPPATAAAVSPSACLS